MKAMTIIAITFLMIGGCASRDKNGNLLDTPTSGSIVIAADESLKPILDAEITAFEGIYHNAHIQVTYTSEEEAINMALHDSARLAIVTRKLTQAEEKELIRQTIVPRQLRIALDGIAIIQNLRDRDSTITTEGLSQILSTAYAGAKGEKRYLKAVVFDHPNSGIVHYLQDSLQLTKKLSPICFALHGNASVIDYVAHTPGTLGLIDVSWISDRDDSASNSFLKSIRVMSVLKDSVPCQPYQAYLAQRQYPFLRDVIMISREARSGLANGFMAFVASDRGQRVVLKSGLVPATMPIRIVEVNRDGF
jgi:phosphate transport system substrate-binding protein